MTLLRRHIALILVLALTLTGHQAAQARGMQTAVGTMVICVGQTVVTVQVDADGQPVEHVHLCPDISLFVAEAAGFAQRAPEPAWVAVPRDRRAVAAASHAPVEAQARGPPFAV